MKGVPPVRLSCPSTYFERYLRHKVQNSEEHDGNNESRRIRTNKQHHDIGDGEQQLDVYKRQRVKASIAHKPPIKEPGPKRRITAPVHLGAGLLLSFAFPEQLGHQKRTERPLRRRRRSLRRFQLERIPLVGIDHLCFPTPVSYTHLDVYKRQR